MNWGCWAAVMFWFQCFQLMGQKPSPVVTYANSQLNYTVQENGDRLPDFSYAGYRSFEKAIPWVEAKVNVPWQSGDQTERIQSAIDYVSSLPLEKNGFRGAVQLQEGVYEVNGNFKISNSGVVLRGAGVGKTTILGTGISRATLVSFGGVDNREFGEQLKISDTYVPVGASSFTLSDNHEITVGDEIVITRPSTKNWIDALGMNDFGGETGYIGWKEGERDIVWNRKVTDVDGNRITMDVPLTMALDTLYGGGIVQRCSWTGRIANVGVENLTLKSTYDTSNPKDEQHRWMAVILENVQDAWVRQVDFQHFAGSAVFIRNTASRVTVEDCKSLTPVSEVGGQRRYTFYTEGGQCLFQRLYSEYGYHDFGVGFMAPGPNAFVECTAYLPYSFSGAIDSWATGVLFDIVNIDGHALHLGNRGIGEQGAGWTAANSMVWQSTAAMVTCPSPPTAKNWAYAVWAQFDGNGEWFETNSFLKPRSLFYGQLAERIGQVAWKRAHLLPLKTEATSSPTLDQAATYVQEALAPRLRLEDWISQASTRNPISTDTKKVKSIDHIKKAEVEARTSTNASLRLANGRLLFDDRLARGKRQPVQWWRGNVREYDANRAKPHVTRFVPGKTGTGLTDDLITAVDELRNAGVGVLDHNYGLWYDRRRDDHQRVRRMDGEVWAPFYELPFARSGTGTAWDGLSKYDLTKYNDWYWSRLRNFAHLAEKKSIVLYHQNYFQHNILEAGGHYADFPWRTANNINNTPFGEPVNYAGDKRIFLAEQFYDVSDPEYRELHRAYIRQCLDNFAGQQNVIQFTSAEYTGPLSFIVFWLDVISEWEQETGQNAWVALSATKDVQDAILDDPVRSKLVEIIDIRYWYFGENKEGELKLYAPEGGKNLAPRQHARLVKPPKETFESVFKSVSDYTTRFPDKAVIYNTPRSSAFGWAVLLAGGSLMDVPAVSHDAFFEEIAKYKTNITYPDRFELSEGRNKLIYARADQLLEIPQQSSDAGLNLYLINKETGQFEDLLLPQDEEKWEVELKKGNLLWISYGAGSPN